jgi:hypothetical protein
MTTKEYIDKIRSRINDNPNITAYFNDKDIINALNISREYISQINKIYENYQFIIPKPYINEYELNDDYISVKEIIDCKIPNYMYRNNNPFMNIYGNNGYNNYRNNYKINSNSTSIMIAYTPDTEEQLYTIGVFNDNYIDIIGSTSTLSNILQWATNKSYVLTNKNEYINISQIIKYSDTPETYRMYIGKRDYTNKYYNMLIGVGMVNAIAGSNIIRGIGTKFTIELSQDDVININGNNYTVLSVQNDLMITITTNVLNNINNLKYYHNNIPTYNIGDTVQFTSYIIRYNAIPISLKKLNEKEHILYKEAGESIIINTSYLLHKNRGDINKMQIEYQELSEKNKELSTLINNNKGTI